MRLTCKGQAVQNLRVRDMYEATIEWVAPSHMGIGAYYQSHQIMTHCLAHQSCQIMTHSLIPPLTPGFSTPAHMGTGVSPQDPSPLSHHGRSHPCLTRHGPCLLVVMATLPH